jgi:hypothetical protein
VRACDSTGIDGCGRGIRATKMIGLWVTSILQTGTSSGIRLAAQQELFESFRPPESICFLKHL